MELSAPNNADQHVVREAVCSGNLDIVRSRLDENPVLLWIKEPGTNQTLLHLAINNVQYDVARLLLLKGAFSEVPDGEGWKPLACAAMGGPSLFEFAEMLLEFGADVDSMNLQLRRSTLHICAETGFTRLAEMLLERDPQVDLEDVAGQTPLEKAVAWRRTDMVQLLLRHGATRRRNPGQGGAVHRAPMNRTYSPEDEDIKRLLKSSHLLQGPPVSRRSTWDTRPQQTIVARHPTPLDDWAKMTACHAFTATVVDFFIKEKERRIEESVTVYDLLYGRGGDRIMREAQAGQTEAKRSFRWYHLPANNMEWVEALVRRHLSEREPALASYTEAMASELGIHRTQRDPHLIPTAMGSFIRPYSCKVEQPQQAQQSLHGQNGASCHVGAFIPYLHYEMTEDFEAMSQVVASTNRAWTHQTTQQAPGRPPPPRAHFEPREDRETGNSVGGQNTFGPARNNQLPLELTPGMPHRILSQGYTKLSEGQDELGVSPLQHRRTLDHYLYSHLASINRRDRDQVIQKSTAQFGSKMFMVDQLWIWVLDNDTVISCCPLRWDAWDIVPSMDSGLEHERPGQEPREIFVLRDNDPLDVQQAIMRYLRKQGRESIDHVEDLCRVISSTCLSTFDYHDTPDGYHFFDIFESVIGLVMDQTAECLRNFHALLEASTARNELLSALNIRFEQETYLLGEIEDVRDELSILRRVLEDQKEVARDLEAHLSLTSNPASSSDETSNEHTLKGRRVLATHLMRIDKMEALANRAIESIRSLLTLKQQHASLSEAHSARRQAEYTSQQAAESVFYNKSVAEQLELARQQAEATAKQGNMALLFTVVAAVFLPLSFMTSFFTIELDAFPWNGDGKMPLGMVTGIILSVSAGVSVPFILLAFNFEKVKIYWAKSVAFARPLSTMSLLVGFIVVALIVALAVVLSQPLDTAVKSGVCIGLGLVALVALGSLYISYRAGTFAK